MKKKDTSLHIRIDQSTRDELNEIAGVIDVPASQLTRDAVREKVTKLRKTHPKLKEPTNQSEIAA